MTYLLKGDTGEWEVVIGMEVHAQITANTKLFSGASAQFGAEPNSQVSMVDAATATALVATVVRAPVTLLI